MIDYSHYSIQYIDDDDLYYMIIIITRYDNQYCSYDMNDDQMICSIDDWIRVILISLVCIC